VQYILCKGTKSSLVLQEITEVDEERTYITYLKPQSVIST